MQGEFDPKPRLDNYGAHYTFIVDECEELKVREKHAIIRYLQSIRGIGPLTATAIFNTFGLDAYQVLDESIERLKEVPGISNRKYEIASKDYLSRGTAKELYTYLYKYNVRGGKIEKIFQAYRDEAVSMLTKHPHYFFIRGLISFNAAEKISTDEKLDPLTEERIEACSKEALFRAQSLGNTFLFWKDLLGNTMTLLGVKESQEVSRKIAEKVRETIKQMGYGIIDNQTNVASGDPVFYLKETSEAEFGTARAVLSLLEKKGNDIDYMKDIKSSEKKLGVFLSEEQEFAVNMVMNAPLSVVTGGPGTGKTTFQQVLFDVYKKHHPEQKITLGAPTGRAARRMTESSNLPATTLHKILGLSASDEGNIEKGTSSIETGLIVVDEVSMLDIFLSNKLFEAVPEGAQIVCIGDIYQLPSVGPGTVLKSLIESNVIPTARFTKVFRQKDGSCIAENASKINQGEKELVYDEAFTFIEKNTPASIVKAVTEEYEKAIKTYGLDEVCVLTPFRRNTVTGVNQLNPVLKQIVNPLPEGKTQNLKVEGMPIYLGDRVMFTKNKGELTNGDIGYVTDIRTIDRVHEVKVDFKDGRIVTLSDTDLQSLVLAYSTTVHKSQGSEYKCCIIVIDPQHEVLLRRNLVYTAITRAKERVILIGSKNAFYKSIEREDTSTRNSQLADLIKERIT